MCETKTSEIGSHPPSALTVASLQETIALSKPVLPTEASESKNSQQFSYVDSKLQKIQRRLLEVHSACEQVVRLHVHGHSKENQSKQQSELLGLYKQNTQWLFQLLIEAISRIVQLQTCSASPLPREEAPSKEPMAPAIPSPLQEKPIEEGEAPKLSERLDCYEKQIQALEKIIQQQTETIEQASSKEAKAEMEKEQKEGEDQHAEAAALFSVALDGTFSNVGSRSDGESEPGDSDSSFGRRACATGTDYAIHSMVSVEKENPSRASSVGFARSQEI